MNVEIRAYCKPELKELVGRLADIEGVPLSEVVTRILAKHVKRPDLADVPRKAPGRPRMKSTTVS